MYFKFSVKFVKYRVQPGSKRVLNDSLIDLQPFLPLTLPKQEFKRVDLPQMVISSDILLL